MSVNRNRAKLNKANNGREYMIILYDMEYPPYWDEGLRWYSTHNYRGGYKPANREIFHWQRRGYRTWKHNRKTQWK